MSRFDDSHRSDPEYIVTLTGVLRGDPSGEQSCTLWVYWDYQRGWKVDAVPFALALPSTSGVLTLARGHSDNRENSLIRRIISTFDQNERVGYINLFSHDGDSDYAWNDCAVISPNNRKLDVVGSNGRDEIFVTMTGVSKHHPYPPRACTFWLSYDTSYGNGWVIDGVNGALVRTPVGLAAG